MSDLGGAGAPTFVWISPNVNNDMHNGSVQQGDACLNANLAPVPSSSWFKNFNSTVIVTMDENEAQPSPAGGQVPMVVISSRGGGAGAISTPGIVTGRWVPSRMHLGSATSVLLRTRPTATPSVHSEVPRAGHRIGQSGRISVRVWPEVCTGYTIGFVRLVGLIAAE